ncbi:MAG: SagB/ThcOx family dehydrogenase [Halanaerobiales bacterium]|nr:SagB/ThcOx family dehydrogenase [Halanaerobiales bacterium]
MEKDNLQLREFLKSSEWVNKDQLNIPKDQGEKRPPAIKEYDDQTPLLKLPGIEDIDLKISFLKDLLKNRKSRRKYNNESLDKKELSYLLWATQGLRDSNIRLRTVPSGGAVHPFETYIYLNKIKGLKKGLYRYIFDEHALIYLRDISDHKNKIIEASNGQKFVSEAAAVFFWTVIPKRGEWKYGPLSHKLAALDAGHLCQNLYLAVESIGAGTCAVDAYNQIKADQFLQVDGDEEFVIYMAPVGKIDD